MRIACDTIGESSFAEFGPGRLMFDGRLETT